MRTSAPFLLCVLSASFGLVVAACPPPEPKGPLVAPDASDGAFPVLDPSAPPPEDEPSLAAALYPACVRACSTLREKGCPEAATLPGGKTCYRICADGETNGLGLKPACVAAATSVDGIRLCGTVRCLPKK